MVTRVSVICVGNEYQRDDGFGPAVARYLTERYQFPVGVEVLDRAVMGYPVISDLLTCEAAIVVDAVDGTGRSPGTLLTFDPTDVKTSGSISSLHEMSFADVLEKARFLGAGCTEATCFGVQVGDMGDGTMSRGLSDAVGAAVAPCARTVVRYLAKTYWLYATDLWQATHDDRALLDDPAAYIRAALREQGAYDMVAKTLASLEEGAPLADYEADELIERALRGR